MAGKNIAKIAVGLAVAAGATIWAIVEKLPRKERKSPDGPTITKRPRYIKTVKCSLCGKEIVDNEENYAWKLHNLYEDLEMDKKFLFLYTRHKLLDENVMHCYGDVCEYCYNRIDEEYQKANTLERVYQANKDVIEKYPKNYAGEIPVNAGGEYYETEYYINKEDPLEELKRYAVITHRSAIVDFNGEIYEQACEGNYIYKKWKATGRVV